LGSEDQTIDTLSGLLVVRLGRILRAGDVVEFDHMTAEVVDVKGGRARQIRLTLKRDAKGETALAAAR
jgi:CBS domain containing-hemolysin-like protein